MTATTYVLLALTYSSSYLPTVVLQFTVVAAGQQGNNDNAGVIDDGADQGQDQGADQGQDQGAGDDGEVIVDDGAAADSPAAVTAKEAQALNAQFATLQAGDACQTGDVRLPLLQPSTSPIPRISSSSFQLD